MNVAIIAAGTLCGRISPVGMGSAEDRALLEQLRDRTCASLIGAGTLRAEDPEMRGTDGILPVGRIRSVVCGSGQMPQTKKIFHIGPPPLIFTGHDRVVGLTDALSGLAEVKGITASKGALSMSEIITELARRGVKSLLIEGGGGLNHAALAQGVVDEVYFTITPFLSGDQQAVSLAHGLKPLGNPFLPLTLLSCRQSAVGELFLHYRIARRP